MANSINTITITNCNNISKADIDINENYLNIIMAPNGTGKSTVARAIYLQSNEKDLSELRTYGSDDDPTISFAKPLEQVLVFNEDFVNDIVFKDNSVIDNSFEVFIKSPIYEERLRNVNERLHGLKIEIGVDEELAFLLQIFTTLSTKIIKNSDGSIKQNPFYKSIQSQQHLYKIPENLIKFKPFIENDYTIEWIDWKNKGFQFDDQGTCPFCTEKFISTYEEEKQTFSATYKKSSAKNLKDFLADLVELKEYITSEKYNYLHKCIKTITNMAEIETTVFQFITEINYLVDKTTQIAQFDSLKISSEDITNLAQKIVSLKIAPDVFNMFKTEKNFISSIEN